MGPTSLQADGVTDRPHHRLTTLYSLKCNRSEIARPDLEIDQEAHIAGHLRFGRLAVHYRTAGEQFPKVLVSRDIATPCEGPRNAGSLQIERARLWLFRVPHGGLVVGMTLDFTGPLAESVPLLEDAYYGEIAMGSDSLLDALRESAGNRLAPLLQTARIGGHGHQLLFVPDSCQDLVESDGMSNRQVNHDLVRRLIYRYDVPYRPDSGLVVFPPETNRRMRALPRAVLTSASSPPSRTMSRTAPL